MISIVGLSLIYKCLSGIVTPIIVYLVSNRLSDKAKVIAYYGHIFAHRMKADNEVLQVHAHTVIITNAGKKTANNIRLGHAELPDYNIFPDVMFNTNDLPQKGKEIIFPTLVPGEQITISYIYFSPMTYRDINTYCKSDEGMAKIIKMMPAPQLKTPFKYFLIGLIILGLATLIYFVLMLTSLIFLYTGLN